MAEVDTKNFVDEIIQKFEPSYYETIFCDDGKGVDEIWFQGWLSDDLLPLLDRELNNQPDKWISSWESIQRTDDDWTREKEEFKWFKEIMIADGYIS